MFAGKQLKAYTLTGAAGAAVSFASATAIGYFRIGMRCRPIAAFATVTTAGTVQSAIITLTSTSGGTTGDCGYLTIPTTAAATYGIYEKTDYNIGSSTDRWATTLRKGDTVTVTVTQASTSGAGFVTLIVEEDPDVFENETLFTATSN